MVRSGLTSFGAIPALFLKYIWSFKLLLYLCQKLNKMTAVEWLYKNLLENPISNQDVEYNEAVFHNAKEMEKQQQGYSEEEVKPLLSFIREIKDNWDCDEDSHKYNTICRCCDAEKTLIEFKNKSL